MLLWLNELPFIFNFSMPWYRHISKHNIISIVWFFELASRVWVNIIAFMSDIGIE